MEGEKGFKGDGGEANTKHVLWTWHKECWGQKGTHRKIRQGDEGRGVGSEGKIIQN